MRERSGLSRRDLLGAAAGAAGSALAAGMLPGTASAAPAAGPGPGLPATPDHYGYSLATTAPQITGSTGSLVLASKASMPVLAGKAGAFALMRVDPGGLREPHWHTDTWELQYYVAGRGTVEIVLVTGECAQLDVGPGDLVFLPQGCGHLARNTGTEELIAVLTFVTDTPRSIGLGVFFSGISTGATTQTLRVPPDTLNAAPKPAKGDPFPPLQYGNSSPPTPGPSLPRTAQALSFALAATAPQFSTPGGTITAANATTMPALTGAGASALLGRIQPGALREPHWHPNAWEINYLVSGNGRFSLVLADGTSAEIETGPGDAVFVPQGAGHAIENSGDGDMTFVSFFNADVATQIGLSTFYGGLPTHDVAQTLRVPDATLRSIPRPTATSTIVPPLP